MDIQRAYLQWVGGRFFPTAGDFVSEARKLGVSRRLPNLRTAAEVAKPGTVIFLLHDDGRKSECLDCLEAITCPECYGRSEDCDVCKGLGSVERGTGGEAVVDGDRWTYLVYVKLRRRPWDPFWSENHWIKSVKPCATCDGRGRVAAGAVFAFFVPNRVEYVLKLEDGKAVKATIEERGVHMLRTSSVSREPRRADRRRKGGAYYAVTGRPRRFGNNNSSAVSAAEQLVAAGKFPMSALEFIGNLAVFATPIPLKTKRFRGLKRFNLGEWRGAHVDLEKVE